MGSMGSIAAIVESFCVQASRKIDPEVPSKVATGRCC